MWGKGGDGEGCVAIWDTGHDHAEINNRLGYGMRMNGRF